MGDKIYEISKSLSFLTTIIFLLGLLRSGFLVVTQFNETEAGFSVGKAKFNKASLVLKGTNGDPLFFMLFLTKLFMFLPWATFGEIFLEHYFSVCLCG